jgi:hypothetical protein
MVGWTIRGAGAVAKTLHVGRDLLQRMLHKRLLQRMLRRGVVVTVCTRMSYGVALLHDGCNVSQKLWLGRWSLDCGDVGQPSSPPSPQCLLAEYRSLQGFTPPSLLGCLLWFAYLPACH